MTYLSSVWFTLVPFKPFVWSRCQEWQRNLCFLSRNWFFFWEPCNVIRTEGCIVYSILSWKKGYFKRRWSVCGFKVDKKKHFSYAGLLEITSTTPFNENWMTWESALWTSSFSLSACSLFSLIRSFIFSLSTVP